MSVGISTRTAGAEGSVNSELLIVADRFPRQRPFDPLFLEVPDRDKPVGAEAAVQLAVGVGPVVVRNVRVNPRSQAIQVEVRVAGHEGIEGPVDHLDLHLEQELALIPLELLAQPAATNLGPDGEHVRPMHRHPILDPGQSVDEAEHPIVRVEGAGHDAAHLLADHEDRGADDFGEGRAPGFFLDLDALVVFRVSGKGADDDGCGVLALHDLHVARTAGVYPGGRSQNATLRPPQFRGSWVGEQESGGTPVHTVSVSYHHPAHLVACSTGRHCIQSGIPKLVSEAPVAVDRGWKG